MIPLTLWTVALGCLREPQSTEAECFAQAADPGSALPQALAGCQSISDEEARGDCTSVALAQHTASTRADCAAIDSERWRGECYFLLAERQVEQDLTLAVQTCDFSIYARECAEHLVRREAQRGVQGAPADHARVIQVLTGSLAASDAEILFWEAWAMARIEADLMVGDRDCSDAPTPDRCLIGLRRARRTLLTKGGNALRCAAFAEGRPVLALSDGRAVLNTSIPVQAHGCRP